MARGFRPALFESIAFLYLISHIDCLRYLVGPDSQVHIWAAFWQTPVETLLMATRTADTELGLKVLVEVVAGALHYTGGR